ncbi:MAG: hypothetical protein FWH32_01955 [Clostridiales bacterium]|nr:hypothetical protein [Clostridiales bacterium]
MLINNKQEARGFIKAVPKEVFEKVAKEKGREKGLQVLGEHLIFMDEVYLLCNNGKKRWFSFECNGQIQFFLRRYSKKPIDFGDTRLPGPPFDIRWTLSMEDGSIGIFDEGFTYRTK